MLDRSVLWRNRNRLIPIGAVVVLLFALPAFIPEYELYLVNTILIMAIFAYGWSLLFSYAGYLSFGQSAFYALGGYTVAIMYRDVTGSVWLAFLAVLGISAVGAAVIGALSVRRGRIYFAFLTLSFAMMIYAVVFRWRGFTGGDDGIPSVMRGALDFGLFQANLEPTANYYYFTLVIALIAIAAMWKMVNSPFGYTLKTMRDNMERASFIGVDVFKYALIAFVISGVYCGLAGALMVSLCGMAYPELSYWTVSGDPVVACLIGGAYTFAGPFVGSIIYVLVRSYLMALVGNWPLCLGIILIAVVLFFRTGIMGFVSERFKVTL